MSHKKKQEALQDRMKLLKTMHDCKEMLDGKFSPKGAAKSHSPFLMSNALAFDPVKMLNKIEEDTRARQERTQKIDQEIKEAKEKQALLVLESRPATDKHLTEQEINQMDRAIE